MYLFKKYVEVYTTMNLTKFFTAKNLLDEHHIPFKDTSTNNQLRLSFNNFRGSNVQLSRDGSVKNIYSLSVGKKSERAARGLLTRPSYLHKLFPVMPATIMAIPIRPTTEGSGSLKIKTPPDPVHLLSFHHNRLPGSRLK